MQFICATPIVIGIALLPDQPLHCCPTLFKEADMYNIKNFQKMSPALIKNSPMAIATALYVVIFMSNI